LVYLIFLSALPPFTTDMYLPALPKMIEQFHSTVGQVNLTLVLFFIFFSASILIWGTLSDKYGRKSVLLLCTAVYVVASLLCAIAGGVYWLVVFRVFQAMGGGATVAVSMAITKDVFEGRERERALAFISIFMVIAPITAPIMGAAILTVMSWRGIFMLLSGFGAIAFTGALLLTETVQKVHDKGVIKTIGNLAKLLKNPGFAYPLPLFSLMSFPVFMFIGASADIYVSGFGLNEQSYSLFFGGNALCSALGPLLYMAVSKHFRTSIIIATTFSLTFASGLFVILLGNRGPFIFAFTVIPATVAASMLRPPSANILLEQGKKDAGAASSLMTFSFVFIGSLGLQFISLDWGNRIFMLGLIYMLAGLVSLALWPLAWKKCNTS
jgi:DHA1 family bicyclomycin/chloramphenicol resistance-like MFS transporter